MFILTLLIAAVLHRTPAPSVPVNPPYAITEDNDTQPALGGELIQQTAPPQLSDPMWSIQAPARTGTLQDTVSVYRVQ